MLRRASAWVRHPPDDGVAGTPCRRRVGFSGRRAWLFFDILSLSRRPFWVVRVELARFTRHPGNLQNFIFRCGLVRFGALGSLSPVVG